MHGVRTFSPMRESYPLGLWACWCTDTTRAPVPSGVVSNPEMSSTLLVSFPWYTFCSGSYESLTAVMSFMSQYRKRAEWTERMVMMSCSLPFCLNVVSV